MVEDDASRSGDQHSQRGRYGAGNGIGRVLEFAGSGRVCHYSDQRTTAAGKDAKAAGWIPPPGTRNLEGIMDSRNFTYMFYGFAAAWAILVIYVITLVSREKKIYEEMNRLKKMIEDGTRK